MEIEANSNLKIQNNFPTSLGLYLNRCFIRMAVCLFSKGKLTSILHKHFDLFCFSLIGANENLTPITGFRI